MESELTRFLTLLNHTVEHNKEHIEKLKNLAKKAQELGKTEAHDDIVKGVEQMSRANEALQNALKGLKQ